MSEVEIEAPPVESIVVDCSRPRRLTLEQELEAVVAFEALREAFAELEDKLT